MSCWVVAALAAEIIGIPVSRVLERIRSGQLPSKTDLGFLLVDVAPHGPRLEFASPKPLKKPATYRSIADVEREAKERMLEPEVSLARSARGGRLNFTPEPELTLEEELALSIDPDPTESPSQFDKRDWRTARAVATRTRQRPATWRPA